MSRSDRGRAFSGVCGRTNGVQAEVGSLAVAGAPVIAAQAMIMAAGVVEDEQEFWIVLGFRPERGDLGAVASEEGRKEKVCDDPMLVHWCAFRSVTFPLVSHGVDTRREWCGGLSRQRRWLPW